MSAIGANIAELGSKAFGLEAPRDGERINPVRADVTSMSHTSRASLGPWAIARRNPCAPK